MSVRCLHIADLHLGRPCQSALAPAKARLRRQEVLASLEKTLRFCQEENIPLLLIAGDFLEQGYAEPGLVEQVVESFRRASSIHIAISPGNHDPITPESPYRTLTWPQNVHIFQEERLQSWRVPGMPVVVHGLGWNRTHIGEPLLRGFRVPKDGAIHILLVHGDLDPAGGSSDYLPLTSEQLQDSGADYAALGHIHQFPEPMVFSRRSAAAYAGSFEPMAFDEQGEHGGWLVEWAGDDGRGELQLRRVALACRQYRTKILQLTESDTPLQQLEKMRRLWTEDERRRDFCRIRLTGRVAAEHAPDLPMLRQALSEEFFHLELVDETVRDFDLEQLRQQFSHGVLGRFIERMTESDRVDARHALLAANETAVAAEAGMNPGKNPERESRLRELALQYGIDALLGRRVRP